MRHRPSLHRLLLAMAVRLFSTKSGHHQLWFLGGTSSSQRGNPMQWLAQHKDELQALGSLGFLCSAIVVLVTFAGTLRSTINANRRTALSELAKMYVDWNSEIVRNPDVRSVKRQLIWDRYGFTDVQVQKIHFVHQALAILLMEWNIGTHYRHESDQREARSSLRGVLGIGKYMASQTLILLGVKNLKSCTKR